MYIVRSLHNQDQLTEESVCTYHILSVPCRVWSPLSFNVVVNTTINIVHASCNRRYIIDCTSFIYISNAIANFIAIANIFKCIAIYFYHTWLGTDWSYFYTTNLLCQEHSSLNRATSIDPRLLLLHTPLVLSSRKQCLLTHPDQDLASYILDGIPKEFSIGRDTLHPLHSTSKNMLPARENPKVIEEYLQGEI